MRLIFAGTIGQLLPQTIRGWAVTGVIILVALVVGKVGLDQILAPATSEIAATQEPAIATITDIELPADFSAFPEQELVGPGGISSGGNKEGVISLVSDFNITTHTVGVLTAADHIEIIIATATTEFRRSLYPGQTYRYVKNGIPGPTFRLNYVLEGDMHMWSIANFASQ